MKNLDILRREINDIDAQIVQLFAERFDVVKKIGDVKNSNQLPILDRKREKELVASLKAQAKKHYVSEKFIERVWQAVFKEAYKHEQ